MSKRKLKKRIERLELEVMLLRDDVERLAKIIQDLRLSEVGTMFVTTSVPRGLRSGGMISHEE